MSISKADAKKRVTVTVAQPGDVFDVQRSGDDRIVLVRLAQPEAGKRMSRTRCLEAIASAPLRLTTTWEELRAITREP